MSKRGMRDETHERKKGTDVDECHGNHLSLPPDLTFRSNESKKSSSYSSCVYRFISFEKKKESILSFVRWSPELVLRTFPDRQENDVRNMLLTLHRQTPTRGWTIVPCHSHAVDLQHLEAQKLSAAWVWVCSVDENE